MSDRLTKEERSVLEAAQEQRRIGDEPCRCKHRSPASPVCDEYLMACRNTEAAARAYRESQQKWRAGSPCYISNRGGTIIYVHGGDDDRDRVLALLNAGEKALEEK